jgi:hypothetical protein
VGYKSFGTIAVAFKIFEAPHFLLSPNMQLLAAITASLLLVSSATAQSIGLFTEKDFDGEALFPAVDPGACNVGVSLWIISY